MKVENAVSGGATSAPLSFEQAVAEEGATLEGAPANAEISSFAPSPGEPVAGGRYRLGRLLGEGGMGSVYEAEQLQPLRRRVAVKLIKLGMDTRQVVARFASERQALAMLDHPGIARVYDAGATAQGRPFFAMELVEGAPITRFCDEHGLSIAQRLEVFAAVCDAVQHAHQKGIIHRDLKPSNVLVGVRDGRPAVKVIDFGVAKATAGSLGELTLTGATAGTSILGTPEYMSPEQASGDVTRLDTRSDVYALGVMLYELLTGVHPFAASESRRTPEQLRALIRDSDPPRPSKRLTSMTAGSDVAELARRRDTQPSALVRTLRRELDWIPLKAMHREPDERYGSAAELAQDVRNFLCGFPLRAMPPSATYRLRKSLRRHRGAFLAAASLALVLVIGIAASTTFAFDASRQAGRAAAAELDALAQAEVAESRRREAQEERADALAARQEAEEVNQFLVDLLGAASPSRSGGQQLSVLEAVERAVAKIDEQYADRPRIAATVKVTAGQTLTSLSRFEEGERLLREGLALRERELGPADPQTGEALLHLAGVLDRRGRPQEAEQYARRSVEVLTAAHGTEDPLVLAARTKLAQTLSHQRRAPEAEAIHREVLEVRRRTEGSAAPETLSTVNDLAVTLFNQARPDEAIAMLGENLPVAEETLGPGHLTTLDIRGNLGTMLAATGRFEEALPHTERTYADARRVLGPLHMDTLAQLNTLANLRGEAGQKAEAVGLFRELAEGMRQTMGPDHPRTLAVLSSLGTTLSDIGELAEAETILRDALDRSRGLQQPMPVLAGSASINLGRCLLLQGRVEEGRPLLEQGLQMVIETVGPSHPTALRSMASVVKTLEKHGLADAAQQIRERYSPAAPEARPE